VAAVLAAVAPGEAGKQRVPGSTLWCSDFSALRFRYSFLDAQRRILDSGFSILNPQRWIPINTDT